MSSQGLKKENSHWNKTLSSCRVNSDRVFWTFGNIKCSLSHAHQKKNYQATNSYTVQRKETVIFLIKSQSKYKFQVDCDQFFQIYMKNKQYGVELRILAVK